MSKLTFATEEAKAEALEKIDFDQRNVENVDDELAKIEEIMNAEVTGETSAETGEANSETQPPEETTVETPTESGETEAAEAPSSTETSEQEPDEIIKLRAELEEKNKVIQGMYGSVDTVRSLEEKVKSLETRSTEAAETKEEKVEAKLREMSVDKVLARRDELHRRYPSSEDRLDPDFIKAKDEIESDLIGEIASLTHNIKVVNDRADQVKSEVGSYKAMREQEETEKRVKSSYQTQKSEVEEFVGKHQEFALTKSFDDVDKDYKGYQRDVARTYFGREPKNTDEIGEAMSQLQRRSPHLINKLTTAGIPTEPTEDMKRYLGVCELWDGWVGYRIDPLTGDYRRDENGRPLQLTRYEPKTGKRVPDMYPSLEATYNDQVAKNGYYTKQIVKAKIAGGKEALQAASRRTGAKELGPQDTGGGPVQAAEEAYKRAMEMDVESAIMMARGGDHSLLKEYNDLARTLGWPEINENE